MHPTEAANVLRQLAHGHDPFTGAELPTGHVCQQPQVIRALFVALERLYSTANAPADAPPPAPPKAAAKALPQNAGMPWDETLDRSLCEAFAVNPSLGRLAGQFGRTQGSVRSRLVRLGKIKP